MLRGCVCVHCAAFRLFDRMMLLLRGRVVYFGPRGSDAVEYFKAAPLPEGQMMTSLAEGANEAEWIVDITTQADRQQRCCTPAHQTKGCELAAVASEGGSCEGRQLGQRLF